MVPTDTWNPDQYERFREERSRPFHDLLARVTPVEGMRVVDLGCGTGALTKILHETLHARETIGIDTSEAMLAKAAAHAGGGLSFRKHDLADFASETPFDLVFSNAAVHWVPDHARLFPRLAATVAPRGQLAIQMPANFDHPSHTVAAQVAREAPFAGALGGYVRADDTVLAPAAYAQLLFELGFPEPRVTLEVYPHVFEERGAVIEWVKGTLLTDYQKRMPADLFDRFLARYRESLFAALPDRRPFFYPFKRILMSARRA